MAKNAFEDELVSQSYSHLRNVVDTILAPDFTVTNYADKMVLQAIAKLSNDQLETSTLQTHVEQLVSSYIQFVDAICGYQEMEEKRSGHVCYFLPNSGHYWVMDRDTMLKTLVGKA